MLSPQRKMEKWMEIKSLLWLILLEILEHHLTNRDATTSIQPIRNMFFPLNSVILMHCKCKHLSPYTVLILLHGLIDDRRHGVHGHEQNYTVLPFKIYSSHLILLCSHLSPYNSIIMSGCMVRLLSGCANTTELFRSSILQSGFTALVIHTGLCAG